MAVPVPVTCDLATPRRASRRPSFKVRPRQHHHAQVTPTKVTELAKRYNELSKQCHKPTNNNSPAKGSVRKARPSLRKIAESPRKTEAASLVRSVIDSFERRSAPEQVQTVGELGVRKLKVSGSDEAVGDGAKKLKFSSARQLAFCRSMLDETDELPEAPVPNNSFLWRSHASPVRQEAPPLPALPPPDEDIYETVEAPPIRSDSLEEDGYEVIGYKDLDYEEIYETLPENKDVYESIKESESCCYDNATLYESISRASSGSSFDQQATNSLYGTWWDADADASDWEDLSDAEEAADTGAFLIVRGRQRRKNAGWSDRVRHQRSKLENADQAWTTEATYYDSFDSDSDDGKPCGHPDGVETRLPEPPAYGLVRLATSAGKRIEKLRRNWSLTKSDITKSLSRMTKKKSTASLIDGPPELPDDKAKTNKKNWFKKSVSVEDGASPNLDRSRSTFYLTGTADAERPAVPARKRNRTSLPVLNRPPSPPPPTPQTTPPDRKEKQRSTSWYTEVGLFKNLDGSAVSPAPPSDRSSSTACWYAEIGLYNEDGSTPSSSSAETSANATGDAAITDDYYNIRNVRNAHRIARKTKSIEQQLVNEPLYQFYDAAVVQNACGENSSDSDGYEEIGLLRANVEPAKSCAATTKPWRHSERTLWREIPDVIRSGVLDALTPAQCRLQEAKFELLTSEVSYLNSLTVLQDHFVAALSAAAVLEPQHSDKLFGNIAAVKRCSERLLNDFEQCWNESIMLQGLCAVVNEHARQHLHVYVRYCENQVQLDASLKNLRESKPSLDETLQRLEASPVCQHLSLYSFLMLPMQRITRYPLLVDAVLRRLSPDADEHATAQETLVALNQVVRRCNDAARKAHQEQEVREIDRCLEFPADVPRVPLIGRTLVKQGELVQLLQRGEDGARLTFGKKFSKVALHFFLFDDLLVIAKKKSDEFYAVIQHCQRSYVELTTGDCQLLSRELQGRSLLFLTLLENHEGRTVEMVVSCDNETTRQRWSEALSPPVSENPDETVYEAWDCPQVSAVHLYQARQPDELTLLAGDAVNVTKKMADGWYFGERLRDGQSGWFPGNHTVEVVNRHVRSRNLRQRYRLLSLTASYISKAVK